MIGLNCNQRSLASSWTNTQYGFQKQSYAKKERRKTKCYDTNCNNNSLIVLNICQASHWCFCCSLQNFKEIKKLRETHMNATAWYQSLVHSCNHILQNSLNAAELEQLIMDYFEAAKDVEESEDDAEKELKEKDIAKYLSQIIVLVEKRMKVMREQVEHSVTEFHIKHEVVKNKKQL